MSNIRDMKQEDFKDVYDMMHTFYTSSAVLSDGSDTIFKSDIENCINDNPFLEGYILEENGEIAGYGMLAKSFSTEFGKPCIWIEDLYVKEKYRGKKLGSSFLKFVQDKYPQALLRLEAELENKIAIHTYKRAGFEVLPYYEMVYNQ